MIVYVRYLTETFIKDNIPLSTVDKILGECYFDLKYQYLMYMTLCLHRDNALTQ